MRKAAVHEQLRARDVAAVVRCEKHDGLRDLIGCAESPERNNAGNHLPTLFARFGRSNAAFISTRDDELQGGRNPKAQLAVVQADRPAGNMIHNLK